MKATQQLESNWAMVKDWTEDARYRPSTREEAEKLIDAIRTEKEGLLTWLSEFW
jgi:hypothetical protein